VCDPTFPEAPFSVNNFSNFFSKKVSRPPGILAMRNLYAINQLPNPKPGRQSRYRPELVRLKHDLKFPFPGDGPIDGGDTMYVIINKALQ
jgi:hypothetical protein